MPFLLQISEDGLLQLFSNWLDIQSLSAFDIAIACRRERLIWLTCLRAIDSAAINSFFHYPSSIKWLIERNITISNIRINPNYVIGKSQFEGLITSSVRAINFRGCDLPDGILTSLALACPLLQHVDLEDCGAHDADMIAFAKECPRLEWISLRFSRGIGATGFMALTENCPLLRSVDFSGFEHLTDMGLIALAIGCPLLKSVKVRYQNVSARSRLDTLKYRCPKGSVYHSYHEDYWEVSDDGVVALVQGCPQLEIIDLTACRNLTAVSIAAIAACCPLLKSIDIGAKIFVHAGDILAGLAQGCTQMTTMRLDCAEDEKCINVDITDEHISVLAQCCPMLHTIDLNGCTRVTDVGIEAIALGCPLLKVLSVRDANRLTGASLLALGAGCPLLEEFSYSKQATFTDTDFSFLLTECPHLRVVECRNHVTPWQVLAEKCPNLQYILLHGDRQCAMIVRGCHKLEVVEIGSTTTDGVKTIARGSPLLSDIRLCDCDGVTDEGIIVLAGCCPMLHTIDLTGCTRVTDIGVETIALGCPLLKTVYLNGCCVSAKGVNALIRSCPHLIFLSMNSRIRNINSGPKLTLERLVDRYENSGIHFIRGDYGSDIYYDRNGRPIDDCSHNDYYRQDDNDDHDDYGDCDYNS